MSLRLWYACFNSSGFRDAVRAGRTPLSQYAATPRRPWLPTFATTALVAVLVTALVAVLVAVLATRPLLLSGWWPPNRDIA